MPECKQVEKFQSRKPGTIKAVSKSAVFGVYTIPQSVTFPSHAVWKPALFCDGKSDGIVQFCTGIV